MAEGRAGRSDAEAQCVSYLHCKYNPQKASPQTFCLARRLQLSTVELNRKSSNCRKELDP